MEEHLIVTLNDNLDIINLDSRKTSGLAHQLALRITDNGYRARVIAPEDATDIRYLYDQLVEKRTMGFIREYGSVPNGTRSPGEGCRTVGNMIYPAFGGKIEGAATPTGIGTPVSDEALNSQREESQVPDSHPLPLSSDEFEKVDLKITAFPDKQYKITIGGKLAS